MNRWVLSLLLVASACTVREHVIEVGEDEDESGEEGEEEGDPLTDGAENTGDTTGSGCMTAECSSSGTTGALETETESDDDSDSDTEESDSSE